MARRQGRGRGPAASSRGQGTAGKGDYEYVGGASDLRYAKAAHQRLRQQAVRRWVIRLAVLAVVVFAAFMWGPGVVRRLKLKAQQTTSEYREAGQAIKEGTERRGGAGMEVDSP